MKFACEACGARYQIADEKMSPKGVKVRCKKCGHVNKVKPESAKAEPQEPVAGPSPQAGPSALGSGQLPEFGTNEIPDFGPSSSAPGATPATEQGPSLDLDMASSDVASSEPSEAGEGAALGDSPSAELSSLQDSLQAELDDVPVALPPAPTTEAAATSSPMTLPEEEQGLDSPGEEGRERRSATADLSTDVGIESEIGSAFAAMFSAEGLASDHAPLPQSEEPPPAELPSSAPSIPVDAEWYVAVRDEQLGPLTRSELEQYWSEKRLGPQSLCWKQGMGDWLPMVAVPEFQDLPGMDEAAGDDDVSYEGLPKLRPPSELIPAPAARPASEVDWKPSAASALASLAAEEMADAPDEPSPPAAGTGDLASSGPSAAEAMLAAAVPPSIETSQVPSPATGPIGGATAGVPVSLPTAAPVRPGPPGWLWAAAGGLLIAILFGGGAFYFLRGSGEGSGAPGPAIATVTPDLGAASTPDAGAKAPVSPDVGGPDLGTGDVGPPDAGEAVEAVAEAPKEAAPPPRPRARRRRTRRSAPAPRPSKPASDVDDLLGGATSSRDDGSALPRVPDDGDVFNAIRRHGGEVRGCVAEQMREDPSLKGRMQVKLRIAGTGKVMSVSVSPAQFRDAPVGRCMQRSAKKWRFPRFSGPPFPVEFPVPVQ